MISSVACYCSLCKMSLTPRTDAFLGVHLANHVAGLVVQFSAHYEARSFHCRADAFIRAVIRELPQSQRAYLSIMSHPTF